MHEFFSYFLQLFGTPRVVYVHRRIGEAYNPECVVPTVKYGGGSIMIWHMTSAGVRTPFICSGRINSETHTIMLEQTLKSLIIKIFREEKKQVIFQKDNTLCHTARKSIAWFQQKRIKLFECGYRKDLNPIEHLRTHIKKQINTRKCSYITEFKKAVLEE